MNRHLRSAVVIAAYLAAIVAANLTITHYAKQGHPEVSIYTAFGLVAFDFVARDLLHDWYQGRTRLAVIAGLIAAGSLLSYLANPDSVEIAKWSAIAFACAMTADTVVYTAFHSWEWLERSNASNIVGAAVDSAVFCAGLSFPFVVAFGQFTAKVGGGVLFSLLLAGVARRRLSAA